MRRFSLRQWYHFRSQADGRPCFYRRSWKSRKRCQLAILLSLEVQICMTECLTIKRYLSSYNANHSPAHKTQWRITGQYPSFHPPQQTDRNKTETAQQKTRLPPVVHHLPCSPLPAIHPSRSWTSLIVPYHHLPCRPQVLVPTAPCPPRKVIKSPAHQRHLRVKQATSHQQPKPTMTNLPLPTFHLSSMQSQHQSVSPHSLRYHP
jgi:hypothetical protein